MGSDDRLKHTLQGVMLANAIRDGMDTDVAELRLVDPKTWETKFVWKQPAAQQPERE